MGFLRIRKESNLRGWLCKEQQTPVDSVGVYSATIEVVLVFSGNYVSVWTFSFFFKRHEDQNIEDCNLQKIAKKSPTQPPKKRT